eukprot:8852-Heterococcus_DN1.PRE.1
MKLYQVYKSQVCHESAYCISDSSDSSSTVNGSSSTASSSSSVTLVAVSVDTPLCTYKAADSLLLSLLAHCVHRQCTTWLLSSAVVCVDTICSSMSKRLRQAYQRLKISVTISHRAKDPEEAFISAVGISAIATHAAASNDASHDMRLSAALSQSISCCSHTLTRTNFQLYKATELPSSTELQQRTTKMPSFLAQRSPALFSLWKEVAVAAQAVAKAKESNWIQLLQVYTDLSLSTVALSISLG